MKRHAPATTIAVSSIVALTTAFGLVACGKDDGQAAVKVANIARYCEISTALAQSLGSSGDVAEGAQITQGRAAAAVASMGPALDEMATVAPDEIAGDVETLVGAVRAAADGNLGSVAARAYEQARQRLLTFSARGCPSGATTGD